MLLENTKTSDKLKLFDYCEYISLKSSLVVYAGLSISIVFIHSALCYASDGRINFQGYITTIPCEIETSRAVLVHCMEAGGIQAEDVHLEGNEPFTNTFVKVSTQNIVANARNITIQYN